jgi:hypothetical protein
VVLPLESRRAPEAGVAVNDRIRVDGQVLPEVGQDAPGVAHDDADPGLCGATYLRCWDFNSSIGPWKPIFGNPPVVKEVALPAGGNEMGQYWTPDLGDGDRAITMYRTGLGHHVGWQAQLINTTPAAVSEIEVTYDLEGPWVNFAAAEKSLSAQIYWVAETVGDGGKARTAAVSSPKLDNALVDAQHKARWLDNVKMDGIKLRVTGQVARLTGAQIAPASRFVVRFGISVYDPQSNYFNVGVDNVKIRLR